MEHFWTNLRHSFDGVFLTCGFRPSIKDCEDDLQRVRTPHNCMGAQLSVAGAWPIFWGGENNICHVVYTCEMLASDVCYLARVCFGLRLCHDSMWAHPWEGIHIQFARVNAYYDKARYKSLIARENITQWNITRHPIWVLFQFISQSQFILDRSGASL